MEDRLRIYSTRWCRRRLSPALPCNVRHVRRVPGRQDPSHLVGFHQPDHRRRHRQEAVSQPEHVPTGMRRTASGASAISAAVTSDRTGMKRPIRTSKQIVRLERTRLFNAANVELGLRTLTILSPREVTTHEGH